MVKITVFFTVIAVSILIDRVYSSQRFNIQSFLQALQQQLALEQRQQRAKNQHLSYVNDEENDSYFFSLKKKDVDQLIHPSQSADKYQRTQKNKKLRYQLGPQYFTIRRPFEQGGNYVPNDLLFGLDDPDERSYETNDRDDDDLKTDRHNEYSKVYVVLNSEAIKKSQNKDKLNALLSSLLAAPPQEHDRYLDWREQLQDKRDQHRTHLDEDKHNQYQVLNDWNQDQRDRYRDWYRVDADRYQDERDEYDRRHQQESRYKGFRVRFGPYRRKRDSKEIYDTELVQKERPRPRPRDMPREKPRRLRDRGGAGGHTAIPYIHQRGDIYERED